MRNLCIWFLVRSNLCIFLVHTQINLDKVWTFADPEEMTQLQEQNDNLRAVIKEMRNQMEYLGQELPPSDEKDKPQESSAAKGRPPQIKRTHGILLTEYMYY